MGDAETKTTRLRESAATATAEVSGEDPATDQPGAEPARPLIDDLHALFEDGKTYAQAELNFQRSRGSYVANRTKRAVLSAFALLGALHLALIALVVGAVIALTPLVGAWWATVIVVSLLLAVSAIFLALLLRRVGEIRYSFEKDSLDEDGFGKDSFGKDSGP